MKIEASFLCHSRKEKVGGVRNSKRALFWPAKGLLHIGSQERPLLPPAFLDEGHIVFWAIIFIFERLFLTPKNYANDLVWSSLFQVFLCSSFQTHFLTFWPISVHFFKIFLQPWWKASGVSCLWIWSAPNTKANSYFHRTEGEVRVLTTQAFLFPGNFSSLPFQGSSCFRFRHISFKELKVCWLGGGVCWPGHRTPD